MPNPPPYGEDLPEGTVLYDPESTQRAIRCATNMLDLWFVFNPSGGGAYTNGYGLDTWTERQETS